MSKPVDMQVVPVAKKARTDEGAAVKRKEYKGGLFVQVYQKGKPWSLQLNPWQYIHTPCFNLQLSQEHNMGINICSAYDADDPELVTLLPYGRLPVKCTGRDGCGSVLQRGQALQWKANCLLHFQCGTVSADVMLVRIDLQHVDPDGALDVESIVRAMFLVDGPDNTTEPCWLPASILENHRDSWKHRADEFSKQITQLHVDKQQLHEANLQTIQEVTNKLDVVKEFTCRLTDKLQVYKDAMLAIEKIATCGVCMELMPEKEACMMAPCGHYICAECFNNYFHGLGADRPYCSTCSAYAPKDHWQSFFCMTGIAEAVKKTKQA